MRDRISAPIKLSFCFFSHDFRIYLINKFAFCLFFFVKYCQIYLFVSCNSIQRISTFVIGFFEHTIKLSCSAFFT